MKRRHDEHRAEADRRYANLRRFLSYLHEDHQILYGSTEGAIAAAIGELPFEILRAARQEARDLLDTLGNDVALRDMLYQGMDVALLFKQAGDARTFAEMIEQRLMAVVKDPFDEKRTPSWKRDRT